MNLSEVILRTTRATQPAAASVPNGTLCYIVEEDVHERSNGSNWQSWGTNATGARPPTAHAPTHSVNGGDPVSVTTLAGYPGGTTLFLRADRVFAVPPGGGSGGGPGGAHGETHVLAGSDPIPNVAWTNTTNAFAADQFIQKNVPILSLIDTAQPINGRVWRLAQFAGNCLIQASDDVGSTTVDTLRLGRNGDAAVAGTLTAAGFGATPLNASQLTTGVIPDARLSSTVALVDARDWAPSIAIAGGVGSISYGAQWGSAVKVGPQVTAQFRIQISAISGAGSGPVTISNLPFVNTHLAPAVGPCVWFGLTTVVQSLSTLIGVSSNVIYLYYNHPTVGSVEPLKGTMLAAGTDLYGTIAYRAAS